MARLPRIPGASALRGAPAAFSRAPKDSSGVLVLIDTGLVDKINLRCDPNNQHVLNGLSRVVGTGLPTEANTFAVSGNRLVIWLGPDEWLILAEDGAAQSIVAILDIPESGHIAVTNVSDALGGIIIDGPHSRDVLAKHCALDFHPTAFTPGMAQQSLLSHATMILMCLGENRFRLIGRSSFMPYILELIQDAALEYGFEYHPVES